VGTQDVGDVTITKVDDPDPVEVNGLLLYTLEVTNTTGSDQEVVVEDDLPDEVDFIAVDVNGGTADECFTSNSDPEVVCVISLEPQGDNDDNATIQILVEPQETGTIENFADVFLEVDCGSGDPPDCTSADPTDSVSEETEVVNDRNNNNNNKNDNRRDRFRDFLRDRPFFDNPFIDQYLEDQFLEDLEEAEEDLNNEISTLEEDQYNDEGEDGVSATSDQYGAEASTPGAVAHSDDPDQFAPETSAQGDVVDEVPTSGPLPNTGGVPIAAGTVLALVLFGGGLLAVRLVMVWRERRT
jgi:hypothetical protein